MNGEKGSVVSFVDTNILFYALASDDDQRSIPAQNLIKQLMNTGAFRTSTQVLQELFVTLTRKSKLTADPELALSYLDAIAKFPVIMVDYPAIRESADLSIRDRLSFWDSLIVVCAARAGSKRLYSEDMQHGRKILGLEIINPFHVERR